MITARMRKDGVHCSLHGYVFGERSPRNQQRHAAALSSRDSANETAWYFGESYAEWVETTYIHTLAPKQCLLKNQG
jgi:hypothetical protein